MSGVELTEFVLARISEDEDTARAAAVMPYAPLGWAEHVISAERDSTPSQDEHVLRHDPARVLAECAAKRRIVEHDRPAIRDVLELLALPYADHPDYREEWRP